MFWKEIKCVKGKAYAGVEKWTYRWQSQTPAIKNSNEFIWAQTSVSHHSGETAEMEWSQVFLVHSWIVLNLFPCLKVYIIFDGFCLESVDHILDKILTKEGDKEQW